MRIFIFEFLTGGGLLGPDGHSPAEAPSTSAALTPLVGEGAAMVTALATDFAALYGLSVHTLRDNRLEFPRRPGVRERSVGDFHECLAAFDEEAARADWTIVIAPESQGVLAAFAARAIHVGGRLLGPGLETIRLASDKHRLAECLSRSGVPTPAGAILPDNRQWPIGLSLPAVLKPRDGAGSQHIRKLHAPLAPDDWPADPANWRVEEFHPGLAASVACLCGPALRMPLAPCAQLLSDDGCFHYLGGRLPLNRALAERAARLAARAVATLPNPFGYIGVDLVLGADVTGRDDVVIEINPRLTTSYVGLRDAVRENLAAAMLSIAAGEQPKIDFRDDAVEFRADGSMLR